MEELLRMMKEGVVELERRRGDARVVLAWQGWKKCC